MNGDKLALEKEAWQSGYRLVAGVDEAGRGPLAGPLVAAAVILGPAGHCSRLLAQGPPIGDSKALRPRRREIALDYLIKEALAITWAVKSPAEVDRIGPLAAALAAMSEAVELLAPGPDLVLVDGNQKPPLNRPGRAVVKGDALSASIGAASIVAKVIHDWLLARLHRDYPQYGFNRNQGYGTKAHRLALAVHGPCPAHRLTYRGVLKAEPARRLVTL